jgi:hypothetical protein
VTDFCSSRAGANRTKLRDLGILTSFLKFCHRADFTPEHIGDGLFKTMNCPDDEGQREPSRPKNLNRSGKYFQISPMNTAGWGKQR